MLDILKEQVVAVDKEAERLGMCRHKSGNFSIYDPETGYVVITPAVWQDYSNWHVCYSSKHRKQACSWSPNCRRKNRLAFVAMKWGARYMQLRLSVQ